MTIGSRCELDRVGVGAVGERVLADTAPGPDQVRAHVEAVGHGGDEGRRRVRGRRLPLEPQAGGDAVRHRPDVVPRERGRRDEVDVPVAAVGIREAVDVSARSRVEAAQDGPVHRVDGPEASRGVAHVQPRAVQPKHGAAVDLPEAGNPRARSVVDLLVRPAELQRVRRRAQPEAPQRVGRAGKRREVHLLAGVVDTRHGGDGTHLDGADRELAGLRVVVDDGSRVGMRGRRTGCLRPVACRRGCSPRRRRRR